MRFLLTSAGLSNESLRNALEEMVGEEVRIAFIPTAANVEEGSKDWLVNNYSECLKVGTLDIVDISALDKSVWLPRLQKCNVIMVGGGNTSYLMKCIIKSDLVSELPILLRSRIYVGISAGSIVMSKQLAASSEFLYGDEIKNAPKGLGYINFNIRPHLNSPHFVKIRDEELKEIAKKIEGDLYALDDESAVQYVDGEVIIISEGVWKKY